VGARCAYLDAVIGICNGTRSTCNGSTATPQAERGLGAVSIRCTRDGAHHKRLRKQEERLKYELAFFIGQRFCTTATAPFRRTAPFIPGRRSSGSAAGMGAQDGALCLARFRMQFFCRCVSARAFRSGDS